MSRQSPKALSEDDEVSKFIKLQMRKLELFEHHLDRLREAHKDMWDTMVTLTSGLDPPSTCSYRRLENRCESAIAELQEMTDSALNRLGELFDDREVTQEDKDFVVKDEEASSSNYEEEEEEAEFTEEEGEEDYSDEDYEDEDE